MLVGHKVGALISQTNANSLVDALPVTYALRWHGVPTQPLAEYVTLWTQYIVTGLIQKMN